MKHVAPYQIFFPVGILAALMGVGVWLLQSQGFQTPMMWIHSRLMLGGFLWSFVIGFLMTAVPRMSGTESASGGEKIFALLLIVAQMGMAFVFDPHWFYGTNALLILFLISFGLRRILKMTKTLPIFFSNMGLAMVLALAGCYCYAISYSALGLWLYYVGPLLLLVLGIGTRFFAFLSGLPSELESSSDKKLKILFHVLGISVALGLVFLGLGSALAALFLALVTLIYILVIWKIFRTSARPSALKYAVRVVAFLIPTCFLLCWLWPDFSIAWCHILFIGCFSLMTFAVATRVTLAHGAYSLEHEIKSKTLWVFLLLVMFALIFRIAYGLSSGLNRGHLLHIAISFWFAAVLSWCFSFFRRIYKAGELRKPSCR